MNIINKVIVNTGRGQSINEDSYISVKDMAKFVQEKFNPSGKVVFYMRDDMGYAPTTKLRLATEKLSNLGWKANNDLYAMFSDVISHLREKQNTLG